MRPTRAVGGARREQRVLHRLAEREALDPLRCPVGRDLPALYSPHLLGVGLEEDLEQPSSEAVADPVLERPRVGDGKAPRPGVTGHAAARFEHAEVEDRLPSLERIGEEPSAVEDPRQPRPLEHVGPEQLAPQGLDLGALGEEAVAPDVEAEHAVGCRRAVFDGPRQSPPTRAGSALSTVTAAPPRVRSHAAVSPAGPAPTIATRGCRSADGSAGAAAAAVLAADQRV